MAVPSDLNIHLNLDEVWGYDGETLRDILRDAVKETVKAEMKKIAKDLVVKRRKELEKVLDAELSKVSKLKIV